MRLVWYVLLVSAFSILFISCVAQKDETTTPNIPNSVNGISVVSNDSLWVISDSTYRTITVQVDGGGIVDSLWLELQADSLITIPFADDGGNNILPTPYPWLLPNSGDVIPGDGIWSRRVRTGFGNIGNYTVRYVAQRGSNHWAISSRWSVVRNIPPRFSGLVAPDSLFSGMDSSLDVSAIDPDTLIRNSINSVVAHIYDTNHINIRNVTLDPTGGGQRWRLRLPYSFAAGLKTESYRFEIRATDYYGGTTDTTKNIWIQNLPCRVDSISLSGTAILGNTVVLFDSLAHDTVYFVFRVVFDDPQSPIDVKRMIVRLTQDKKPAQTLYRDTLSDGSNSDPIGDGIIYSGFQLNNHNRHPGNDTLYDNYHITFAGIDGGGNIGRDSTFTFYIQQPGRSYAMKSKSNVPVLNARATANPFSR